MKERKSIGGGYLKYKDCFVGEVSVLLAQKEKQEESIYTVK